MLRHNHLKLKQQHDRIFSLATEARGVLQLDLKNILFALGEILVLENVSDSDSNHTEPGYSYWEINISLNGNHFFATHPRSITERHKLLQLYKKFLVDFPESQGYKISVTYQEKLGHLIDVDEMLKADNPYNPDIKKE